MEERQKKWERFNAFKILGKLSKSNGESYTGDWADDKKNGVGIVII